MRPSAWLFGATVAASSIGCGHPSIGSSPAPVTNHPQAVVGEWIDQAHTAPGDTMVWVLGPNGDDDTRHLSGREHSVRHYGRWFVADGRLCFVRRPGRSGSSCVAFETGTVEIAGVAHRRLVLHGYQGVHQTRDRELIERLAVATDDSGGRR